MTIFIIRRSKSRVEALDRESGYSLRQDLEGGPVLLVFGEGGLEQREELCLIDKGFLEGRASVAEGGCQHCYCHEQLELGGIRG